MRIKQILVSAVLALGFMVASTGMASAEQICAYIGEDPPSPGARVCTPDVFDPNGFLYQVVCLVADCD